MGKCHQLYIWRYFCDFFSFRELSTVHTGTTIISTQCKTVCSVLLSGLQFVLARDLYLSYKTRISVLCKITHYAHSGLVGERAFKIFSYLTKQMNWNLGKKLSQDFRRTLKWRFCFFFPVGNHWIQCFQCSSWTRKCERTLFLSLSLYCWLQHQIKSPWL